MEGKNDSVQHILCGFMCIMNHIIYEQKLQHKVREITVLR